MPYGQYNRLYCHDETQVMTNYVRGRNSAVSLPKLRIKFSCPVSAVHIKTKSRHAVSLQILCSPIS